MTDLPEVLPEPKPSWADLSVLEEMALRLRAAGAWDHAVADGIAALKRRIDALEQSCRFTRHAEGRVRRPLQDWRACRTVLVAITEARLSTGADFPAPASSCLTAAVWLDRWERRGVPAPTDLRCLPHGVIVVEWAKPYRGVLVDRGQLVGGDPWAAQEE